VEGGVEPAPPAYPPPESVAAGDVEGGGDEGGGDGYEPEDLSGWMEEEAEVVWLCIGRGRGRGGGKAEPVIGAKGKGEGKGVIHHLDGGFWSGSWVGFADDKGKGKATNVLLTREHE
jgi:hypothetical protein